MDLNNIKEFFIARYPNQGMQQKVREVLIHVCEEFVLSDLADENFISELCSGSEAKFWSCLSEALLASKLKTSGLKIKASKKGGPDFLLSDLEKKVWIEVICPEPKGLPKEWIDFGSKKNEVIDFPHEQILLRWTSAIKEKAEKLLGNSDKDIRGYIEKGIVNSEEPYVIAVNGCQLRNGPFSSLLGISQFPFAVEAVFAVGPMQIKINKETLKQTGSGYQHRPLISKPHGKKVPAYTFLDQNFNQISAIWAVDMDGTATIGNSEYLAVVHNPNANNPISTGLLPAHSEYVATLVTPNEYELKKIDGSLTTKNNLS